MGSSLSPITACIFMEVLEQKAMANCLLEPILFVRYVDDCFIVYDSAKFKIGDLLNFFNTQCPSIQYTMEEESNAQLPFLDCLVQRQPSTIGSIQLVLDIYRKPTHSSRCMHFTSHQPYSQKTALFKNFIHRARLICKDPSLEFDRLKFMADKNGYPKGFVEKLLGRPAGPAPRPCTNRVSFPYHNNIFPCVQSFLKPFDIQLVSKKPPTPIDAIYRNSPKFDSVPKNCVYEIPCENCDATYIGETTVALRSRLQQHKAAIRNGDASNGPSNHVVSVREFLHSNHTINLDGTRILDSADTPVILRHLESLWIDLLQPITVNQRFETEIHPVILRLVKKYLNL